MDKKDRWQLSKDIFDALKEKGAEIGNASLLIIDRVLEKALSPVETQIKGEGNCKEDDCPLCGTKVTVMGEGETHYYVPKVDETQLNASTEEVKFKEKYIDLIRHINIMSRGMAEYHAQSNYREMWGLWQSLLDFNNRQNPIESVTPKEESKVDSVELINLDVLLLEFKKAGIDTANWDGDEGSEKAIVDGVINLISNEDKPKNLQKCHECGSNDIVIHQLTGFQAACNTCRI